jgi:hypothetical protein
MCPSAIAAAIAFNRSHRASDVDDSKTLENLMVQIVIPGAAELGYGFDITGAYSVSSKTLQIFVETQGVTEWTPTAVAYEVPNYANVSDVTGTSGQTYVFKSKQDFAQHFAQSSSVDVSAGAFSGEFSLAYSRNYDTSKSYYYCMVEALYDAWSLHLRNTGAGELNPDFLSAVQALPPQFDSESRHYYFDFLSKWGTHYISGVTVGGAFRYYLAVDKSYVGTEEKTEVNVKAEYKAVFVSASAESKTEWGTLTKNWTESRTVSLVTEGGDTSSLAALQPDYGDSDSTAFSSWQKSVMQNPAVTNFVLKPLWELVDPDLQGALKFAIAAYSNETVSLLARYRIGYKGRPPALNSCSFAVADQIISPSPNPAPPPPVILAGERFNNCALPASSVYVGLYDPASGETLHSRIYYIPRPSTYEMWMKPPPENQIPWDQIWADLKHGTVSQPGFIAVMICNGLIAWSELPPADMANWLGQLGATLDPWRQVYGYTVEPDQDVYYMTIAFSADPRRTVEIGGQNQQYQGFSDWSAILTAPLNFEPRS